MVGNGLSQVADDRGVGVEQILGAVSRETTPRGNLSKCTITAHARLARHTGGDQNDLTALQRRGEFGRCGVISSDLV